MSDTLQLTLQVQLLRMVEKALADRPPPQDTPQFKTIKNWLETAARNGKRTFTKTYTRDETQLDIDTELRDYLKTQGIKVQVVNFGNALEFSF